MLSQEESLTEHMLLALLSNRIISYDDDDAVCVTRTCLHCMSHCYTFLAGMVLKIAQV